MTQSKSVKTRYKLALQAGYSQHSTEPELLVSVIKKRLPKSFSQGTENQRKAVLKVLCKHPTAVS